MQEFIEQKFNEWTEGLSETDALVNVFNKTRDIPYHIDPELFDLTVGPLKMLQENSGSCIPKHNLIGRMYERMGLSVMYSVYSFHWKDLNVVYPSNILEEVKTMPGTYHLACSVCIDRCWVLVDATWDLCLEKSGFPVNVEWDGFRDTVLAVEAIHKVDFEDAPSANQDIMKKMSDYSLPEKLALSRFSLELNKWLEKIRN